MCGKFTSLKSWREAISLAEGLTLESERLDDEVVAYRVMSIIPVIIWDRNEGRRRVVPMRWGFPIPQDWRRPQPIHARAESIEETKAFAQAFKDGQRGIVPYLANGLRLKLVLSLCPRPNGAEWVALRPNLASTRFEITALPKARSEQTPA